MSLNSTGGLSHQEGQVSCYAQSVTFRGFDLTLQRPVRSLSLSILRLFVFLLKMWSASVRYLPTYSPFVLHFSSKIPL